MSQDRSNKLTTREFISERDLRMFKMRQSGTSTAEIARRFNVTTSVVSKAIQRQLEKLNKEALMAYPEVLRLELERLDNLQQAIWPLTQHRRITLDDGTEVTQEPDLKAIQQVLAIMDRRTKLLGMDQTNVNVQMDLQTRGVEKITAVIAGQEALAKPTNSFDAESEARQLLELMGAAGVLPEDTVRSILGSNELPAASYIEDAEIVDTDEDEEEDE
jgi:transposase-like protein